jgi:acetyltransferase-like isoleucine patch superfamily enzyme
MKQRDLRGAAYNQFRKLKLKLISSFWTIVIRIRLNLINVSFKKPISFYGNSYFIRHRYSKMSIGKNCSFTSTSYFNVAGVNKKNTISTINKDAILTIGDRCGFSGVVICVAKEVTIGENVLVGANCFISDYGFHELDPEIRWTGKLSSTLADPVRIGNNVWLGMNVVVLKGVTIGENSVIGANSLVTKDIPANVIAAGSPCVVKKELKPNNDKH